TTIEADTTEEYKEAVKSLHDQVVKEAQKAPEYKFSDTEEKKPVNSMVSISGTEQSAHGQPAVPTNAAPVTPPATPVAPTPTAPVQPVTTQAPSTAPTTAVPTAPAATAPVASAPQYTFEQLAAAAAPLSDAGKQSQLIE
ncbi:preprotein translocase subunit SecG domain protein, partial [Enterococcus faecalis 06-MB-DW-09]